MPSCCVQLRCCTPLLCLSIHRPSAWRNAIHLSYLLLTSEATRSLVQRCAAAWILPPDVLQLAPACAKLIGMSSYPVQDTSAGHGGQTLGSAAGRPSRVLASTPAGRGPGKGSVVLAPLLQRTPQACLRPQQSSWAARLRWPAARRSRCGTSGSRGSPCGQRHGWRTSAVPASPGLTAW